MVYGCFQAYGPGIIIIINCEVPVIVYRYMAPYKWFIIIMFPIELFHVKTNPAKSAWNLGSNIRQKCHLPLICIGSLHPMLLPYPGTGADSLSP